MFWLIAAAGFVLGYFFLKEITGGKVGPGATRAAKIVGALGLGMLALLLAARGKFVLAGPLATAAIYLFYNSTKSSKPKLGAGGQARQEKRRQPPPGAQRMSVEQAREVLGVTSDARPADIKAAHKRLMVKMHPDHGGSNYLAAQINEAKDLLLRSKQ